MTIDKKTNSSEKKESVEPISKKKSNKARKISIILCRVSLFAFAILGVSSAFGALVNTSSSVIAISMGLGMLLLSVFFISTSDN